MFAASMAKQKMNSKASLEDPSPIMVCHGCTLHVHSRSGTSGNIWSGTSGKVQKNQNKESKQRLALAYHSSGLDFLSLSSFHRGEDGGRERERERE